MTDMHNEETCSCWCHARKALCGRCDAFDRPNDDVVTNVKSALRPAVKSAVANKLPTPKETVQTNPKGDQGV